MKFLLCEIIPRAGFNLATGRFWPAGRMFDTPAMDSGVQWPLSDAWALDSQVAWSTGTSAFQISSSNDSSFTIGRYEKTKEYDSYFQYFFIMPCVNAFNNFAFAST